ncbi:hypothetical protein [Micromonospora yangpuensis]|uniref:Uncharacterized protein n=1 Tax=Micromonospora yangpuensis TaxID=683228 RepID=A0A1C6VIA6_9ACTN|nr:hypothetical protein [Micromonospora yangpuensis]GGM00181.1 hypothetical protein GCM10012279_17180 [Micromonospora yangpuensis]SCL66021.1 hypothetical protein GA0070617_5935 [Micromonospora yangpuensis]
MLPVDERKRHALAWADENQTGDGRGYTAYARDNGLPMTNLRNYVNGQKGVIFTDGEQQRIDRAKEARERFSPEVRKRHALRFSDEVLRGRTVTVAEYARRHDISETSLRSWLDGKGVTYTPDEQRRIDSARSFRLPSDDSVTISTRNQVAAAAAGMRTYGWMTSSRSAPSASGSARNPASQGDPAPSEQRRSQSPR